MAGVAIVVFSDLVDSTALLADLGDDRMDGIRRAHVKDVTDAVQLSGGRVIKTLGDGVMASFESALGALRSAAAIQAAVERLDAEQGGIGVAARVGVAAGEPIADGEDLHGMPVVIASRLSSAAGTGEVLVQDLVQALVASRDGVTLESASDYTLKGIPEPVRASRLRWRELAAVEAGKDEGDARFPSAASAADVRLPPALAAYADEPLIGRDREIDGLREATEPRDRCRAVLILGEPGIGKTRHAAAAAAEAHAEGAVVVLARCPPEPTIAFEPWVRAIGELAQAGDEVWRAALAEAAGAELAALVPELRERGAPADRAAVDEVIAAEGARYRLLRGIGAALALAAGEAPLHVVVDDAHWCDPASAQALGHLVESPPARLVLVVTARDREMVRRHPVSKVLSNLRRTGDLSELRLTGLDASGLAALVGAKVGRAITPGLAAQLQARTSGNPFFAGELARDLEGQGALQAGEMLATAPAPEAVTDLIEERLARLSPDAERLLVAVAAIGPAAPVALAAKAAGLSAEDAERAVGEALSERLVDDVVAVEPAIAFPHALIREALIAEVGEADLTRLHLAIARALEESSDAEPAALARHYDFAVELAGAEVAVSAHRAAATAAAEAHDHEGASHHLRRVLALLPDATDPKARGSILLELGEQELLSADLVRARASFQRAIEASRQSGDTATLAQAALGFAGGDIGFGFESGTDDPAAAALLREGLEALGDGQPRLALRMTFRLAYMLVYSEDDATLAALRRRAEELERQLTDPEARVLAGMTAFMTRVARSADPLDIPAAFENFEAPLDLIGPAEECGREDLRFRVILWSASVHYAMGRIAECEAAIERSGEIAARLGSPRFAWEVDLCRSVRLFDRGKREAAEAQLRHAGTVVRRLRPDLHIFGELYLATTASWIYGGETGNGPLLSRLISRMPGGAVSIGVMSMLAAEGDLEGTRTALRAELDAGMPNLRRPDGQAPVAICWLAHAAIAAEDRESGELVRPLLEPMRSRLAEPIPLPGFGQLPEWYIGGLELLAGRTGSAVAELRHAVARADELEMAWVSAWSRVDLAKALHRGGEAEKARAVLEEAESLAGRYGVGWAARQAEDVRAEIEGREALGRQRTAERVKPIRALAARGGRRALAGLARGLADEDLERRFAEPRRQRALVRAMARGFQPAQAAGFQGVVVYELEPYAIAQPPDAPWRWAIEVDSSAGRARVVEPAPLDPAVTIHFGLADWVRAMAGIENPLTAMVAGRCTIEGDVMLAVRLEAMFGG